MVEKVSGTWVRSPPAPNRFLVDSTGARRAEKFLKVIIYICVQSHAVSLKIDGREAPWREI